MLDAYEDGGADSVWGDIPFERKITHERICLLGEEAATTVDFTSPALAEIGKDSYSVLRGTFDQWLAELAEGAGAEYICGIPVEELVKDGSGSVVGIRAGDDVITAHVVIDCEGVNSLLAERCLGVARPKPSEMAVGVKEVFELTEAQVEDRFLMQRGEGAAMLFVGDCTHGVIGGGFMYTNRDSVSLGLVATIYQVRGMDFAIASDRFAAEAACDAIDAGDVSATGMVSYMAKLEDSFVMKDLETFKTWPRTMEGWESMFASYPGMAAEVFEAMFAVDGVPQRHLKDRIAPPS